MDDRLKRLLYRATHRGTREADRLVGGFAEAHLNDLDPDALERYEALLNESDVDLVNWIMGRNLPYPERHQAILSQIIDFKNKL